MGVQRTDPLSARPSRCAPTLLVVSFLAPRYSGPIFPRTRPATST